MLTDLNWIVLRNMENWIYMNPILAKLLKVPHPRSLIQRILNSTLKETNRILRVGVDHGVILYDGEYTRHTIYQLTTIGKVLLEEYENAESIE